MNVDIYPTTVWLSHLLNDVAAFIRCSCQANILVQLDGHKVHIELGDHWQTDPLSSGKIHFLFVYRLHNVLDGKFRIKLTADSAIVESSLMQTFQSGGSSHMYCLFLEAQFFSSDHIHHFQKCRQTHLQQSELSSKCKLQNFTTLSAPFVSYQICLWKLSLYNFTQHQKSSKQPLVVAFAMSFKQLHPPTV